MKRALLIAGGTVGGLGAVLSITPPQLGSSGISTLAGASADTSANTNNSANNSSNTSNAAAVTSTPTKAATNKATTTKKSTATTKQSTTTNSATNSATTTETSAPAPAPTPAKEAAPAGVTGTFTGDVFNVSYGNVQVKITVSNGKITDAAAIQAPSGRNQRYTDYAIPNLRQQTLSADRKSTRLNSSHSQQSRMPSSA